VCNAKLLICYNNDFDVTASAMNNQTLAFVPTNWRIGEDPKVTALLDTSSDFDCLEGQV
jgi:hypothetical protein